MTRIRYSKQGNTLVSNEDILLPTGELISIVLNTETNSYNFVNKANGVVVSLGTAKNLILLKKLVRNTLLQLGVTLNVEVKTWGNKQTEVAA